MDLMISKTHLRFKHKMIFKWIKYPMNHHKTNKSQRNRQVKKMFGVGDKLIIMIMTVSMNSMRAKKLNKRANGKLLEVIKKKKKIMMRALRIYKKEHTLEILSL
jgi:hypothetical protein